MHIINFIWKSWTESSRGSALIKEHLSVLRVPVVGWVMRRGDMHASEGRHKTGFEGCNVFAMPF